MSQVIMLFLFPIGVYFYFFVEKKGKIAYQKVFDDYQEQIHSNTALNDTEKLQHYKDMLIQNDYKITEQTDTTVRGEKRIFYMSLLAMGLGIYFVGALFYLVYYYWIQDPHVVVYEV